MGEAPLFNMETKCPKCDSELIIRDGNRKCSFGNKQKWLCKNCKCRFVLDPIKKIKGNVESVCMAMDFYFKGMSYRSIQNTLEQFTSIRVTHVTIMNWIHIYMEEINKYVRKLHPDAGKVWHADEQYAKVKGRNHYIWNCLDSKTRFLLANRISNRRNITQARNLFKQAKRVAGKKPKFIITDGFQAYKYAVRKEFATYDNPKPHRRYRTIKQPSGSNNKLERYHSSFRQRDKTMRGFKSKQGANKYIENYRIYYNFLRKHQKLKMTPAQFAGLATPSSSKRMKKMTSNVYKDL